MTVTGKTVGEYQGLCQQESGGYPTDRQSVQPDWRYCDLERKPGTDTGVVKRSAVAPRCWYIRDQRVCLTVSEDAIAAIKGKIVAGDVVIIRYEDRRRSGHA